MAVKSSLFVVDVEIMNGLILVNRQACFQVDRSGHSTYRPIRNHLFENMIKTLMDIKQLIATTNIQLLIKILSKETLSMLETYKQQWIICLMAIHKELLLAVNHAAEQDTSILR